MVNIKIYSNNAAKVKQRQLKRPVIRNKNFALLQDTIVKNISVSKQQRELEQAIINKDFEAYNKLTKGFKDQDKRIHIDNILKAITLLKSGFNNARLTVQEYDPNSEIVEDVEKESDTLLNTLDKRFNELIQMRPRINRLSNVEERRFNAIDREIERYSIDLEKVNSLVKKLEGKEKLSKDRIDKIKEDKRITQERNKISDKVSTLFKYGLDSREEKELYDIFNDSNKSKAFEKEFSQRIKRGVRQLDELEQSLNDLMFKSDIIRKNKNNLGVTAVRRKQFNTDVSNIKKEVIKIRKQIKNAKVNSMSDVKKFFILLDDDIPKISKDVDDIIKESINIRNTLANDTFSKSFEEEIEKIKKDANDTIKLQRKIEILIVDYDKLQNDYQSRKIGANLQAKNTAIATYIKKPNRRADGSTLVVKINPTVKDLFYAYHKYIHDINKELVLIQNKYLNFFDTLKTISKDKLKTFVDVKSNVLKNKTKFIDDSYNICFDAYKFFDLLATQKTNVQPATPKPNTQPATPNPNTQPAIPIPIPLPSNKNTRRNKKKKNNTPTKKRN